MPNLNLIIYSKKKKKRHLTTNAYILPVIYKEPLNPHIQPLWPPACIVANLLQHLSEDPAGQLDYFYFSTLRDKNTWLMVGREGQRKHKLLLKTLTITQKFSQPH